MKPIRAWLTLLLALTGAGPALGAEIDVTTSKDTLEKHFDLITVGEASFTNVWVHRQTNFNVLIRHNGGIHTIKLTDLPTKQLAHLKSQIGQLANIEYGEPQVEQSRAQQFIATIKGMNKTTLGAIGGGILLLLILVVAMGRRNRTEPA